MIYNYWYLPPKLIAQNRFDDINDYFIAVEKEGKFKELRNYIYDNAHQQFHITNMKFIMTKFKVLFGKYSKIPFETKDVTNFFEWMITGMGFEPEPDDLEGVKVGNFDLLNIYMFHTGYCFLQLYGDEEEKNKKLQEEFFTVITTYLAEFRAILDQVRFKDSKTKMRFVMATILESPTQIMWFRYILPANLTMAEYHQVLEYVKLKYEYSLIY